MCSFTSGFFLKGKARGIIFSVQVANKYTSYAAKYLWRDWFASNSLFTTNLSPGRCCVPIQVFQGKLPRH